MFGLSSDADLADLADLAEQRDGYVLIRLAPDARVRLDGLELEDLSSLDADLDTVEAAPQSQLPDLDALLETAFGEDWMGDAALDGQDTLVAFL